MLSILNSGWTKKMNKIMTLSIIQEAAFYRRGLAFNKKRFRAKL